MHASSKCVFQSSWPFAIETPNWAEAAGRCRRGQVWRRETQRSSVCDLPPPLSAIRHLMSPAISVGGVHREYSPWGPWAGGCKGMYVPPLDTRIY